NRRLNLVTSSAVYNNVLNVVIKSETVHLNDDDHWLQVLNPLVKTRSGHLRQHGIRRLTLLIFRSRLYLSYFTFRERNSYAQDLTIRHAQLALPS
ncbi:hypothetical protein DFQ27_004433, partial [Actinomortierella ambigua]